MQLFGGGTISRTEARPEETTWLVEEIIPNKTHHDQAETLVAAPLQTVNRRFFDLTSAIGSEQYHGNYQAACDAAAVNDYIAKEGVFVEHGEFTGRKRKSSADEVYREAISQDNTESALEVIRQGAPRDYVINFDKLKTNLNRIYKKPPTPYTNPFPQFKNVPAILTEWAIDNIRDPCGATTRPKSIIIEGPTRTCKTC
ncbi:hypothetical protein RHGRI_028718 [Rhododendron griersonianum]|uniref:Uncharacterized protein n=1 Tax=Rhododendron griersonianum TaxID=479676 RepID=A0AAV6ILI4_9ERIC|nr:hypothetical protein RHGRI_028718 [Rhododendron griersonianum]